MAKFYEVGGFVRDSLMGLKSKDRDYAVEAESFDAMRAAIHERGGQIFLETPEYLTIRANVPNLGAADYVLCRRDGAYGDGRRPDKVEIGNIYDDLARRDFTVNAIARDEDGVVLDPHDGMHDIQAKRLRAVGSAHARFSEDSLRMVRAFRFAITKGFALDEEVHLCLLNPLMVDLLDNISSERIREELVRCFQHDTVATLGLLFDYRYLSIKLFLKTGIWLKPTMEK